MIKKIVLTSFLFAILFQANGQLQSPNEFLPHNLGEHFTPHYMLVDYFQHVAGNSPNVEILEYGLTNQKRPLLLTFISSEENINNLEAIRENNLRITGVLDGKVDESKDIPIVWMSFGVHGNEAAASESSMIALYDLITKPEAKKWLENTVIIIDPSVNPDGYSRYTHWIRNIGNQNADPILSSREHSEPWPGGRVNHYLFDLNRDWAWASQIETRQRLVEYQKWLPQIHVDFHEQFHNNPYYFAPAAKPYHDYITDWQGDFQTEIGKNHTKYFDKEGWLYFTREVFDLLYPSYGDTYPTFNGAIGMTYEQGGHSRAGRSVLMHNGDTLTLTDRIEHHRTTALSTVEAASVNADKLMEEFASYFDKAQNNPPGEYKTFILKANNPAAKLEKLMKLMDFHGVEYGTINNSRSVTAFDYQNGKEVKHEITHNDLIISAYQPKGILAQVLFEPRTGLEDSLTYDITAWALPYAHGLEAYATKDKISLNRKLSTSSSMIPPPTVVEDPYAYVAPWKSLKSAQFLSLILQKEVKVRFAEEPFEVEGRRYDAGTLVITKADNRKQVNFGKVVRTAASDLNHEIVAVQTGFVKTGHDFGSSNMTFIQKPKILIFSGENTFTNAFGQVWYYFEQDLNYPITIADADNFSRIDLDDFNTIVLAEGSYKLSKDLVGKLNTWISSGGRLIAIGYANRSLEDKKGFNLTRYAKKSDKSSDEKAREKAVLENRTAKYKDRVRASLANEIPGAIFKIKMDNSHPLGFGMKDYYFTLKTSSLRYDLLKNSWNVAYIGDDPMISGFVGSNLKKKLSNSMVFSVQDKGRGSVTYMIDNPLYRAFWEEGKFLFSNALFFVGQ